MTMTQFSIRAGSAFLALSASLVTLTAADAADLPPIYETPLFERAPELQPVEIGTGWYLRGDVGYAFSSDENHSINRRYLVGEGYSVGTVDESIEGKLSVGAGIGYRINDWLRADATAEWLGSADVESSKGTPCDVTLRIADANAPSGYVYVPREDTCSEKSVLDTDVYNYMVNAYADLGTVVGFTPYIGAGLGVANVQSTVKADRLCNERQNFDIAGSERVRRQSYPEAGRSRRLDLAALLLADGRCRLPGHQESDGGCRLPLSRSPGIHGFRQDLRRWLRHPSDPCGRALFALVGSRSHAHSSSFRAAGHRSAVFAFGGKTHLVLKHPRKDKARCHGTVA